MRRVEIDPEDQLKDGFFELHANRVHKDTLLNNQLAVYMVYVARHLGRKRVSCFFLVSSGYFGVYVCQMRSRDRYVSALVCLC